MRFSRPKKQQAVALTPSQRINGDQLTNDASLKAAQAIFKMHTPAVTTTNVSKPVAKPKERPQVTPSRGRSQKVSSVKKTKPVSHPKLASPIREVSATAQAAAAQAAAGKAQQDLVQIESKLNLPPKEPSYLTLPYFRPNGNLSSSTNSRSGSLHSQMSARSGSSVGLDEIVAELQANGDHSSYSVNSSPRGSNDFNQSSTKTRHLDDHFTPSSAHMASVEELPHRRRNFDQEHPLGPSTIDIKSNPNFRSNAGETDSSLASSPSKSVEKFTIRPSSNRSLSGRVPPPKEFIEDGTESVSSVESSRLSELPTINDEDLSDIDLLEYGHSGNIDDYRHHPGSSASDQDRRSIDLDSSEVSYDALSKMPHQIQYRGTLPDLIPNHKRSTKMSKLKSLFGKKQQSEDNELHRYNIVTKDDVTLVKTGQPVKFKTTMRKASHENEPDISSESEKYGSSSEEDVPGKENIRRTKKRVRLGRQIKRASYHHNSHRATFNEDKPWKSHIDIGFVTQAERKRYEGMWVSNRNCYLELLPWWSDVREVEIPEEGLILNLVVSDIWSRSNLPQDRLAAIYNMVDMRKDGTLNRKSFIVGMWLVDQSLYGRKLPSTIDQRVWESVDKYMIGVPPQAKRRAEQKRKHKSLKKEIKSLKKDLKRVQL